MQDFPYKSCSLLVLLLEVEGSAVHAVAELGWFGSILEDMAQMCIAFLAQNFHPGHPMLPVSFPQQVVCSRALSLGIKCKESRKSICTCKL